jgi:hypothetical protein
VQRKAPAGTGAGNIIVYRRKKSKPKTARRASAVPANAAEPSAAYIPIHLDPELEAILERGRKAIENARQALEPSPEELARKARSKEFEEKLHETSMAILGRTLERNQGSDSVRPEIATPPTGQHRESMVSPSDAKKRTKGLTAREKAIWNIIQRGVKGPQYCRELDSAGIAPLRRDIWKDCPRKYESAYLQGEPWRHRIQDEKSRVRRKAELAGPARLASE